ncbi:MAG TPA: hypothetical protein VI300_31880, partial [Solirubrobacter sp.]
MAAPTLVALTRGARVPRRPAARRGALPDIQFDVGEFIGPASTVDGVVVRFPPVYTSFVTVALTRRPTARDRERFASALSGLERRFPFAPRGVLTMIGYGRPYFDRLPAAVVRSSLPRLRSDRARLAFEEAVPGPTDDDDVAIERNDMVLVLRSDSSAHLGEAQRALVLPGLMRVTSRRLQFVQPGLPRRVADAHALPFAGAIDPRSPLWM